MTALSHPCARTAPLALFRLIGVALMAALLVSLQLVAVSHAHSGDGMADAHPAVHAHGPSFAAHAHRHHHADASDPDRQPAVPECRFCAVATSEYEIVAVAIASGPGETGLALPVLPSPAASMVSLSPAPGLSPELSQAGRPDRGDPVRAPPFRD
ncbi:MAG: hypothetical protein WBG08_10015 [Litorimonas sp.]